MIARMVRKPSSTKVHSARRRTTRYISQVVLWPNEVVIRKWPRAISASGKGRPPKCKAAAFGGQGLQPTQGVYQAAAQAAGALDQRE